MSGCWCGRRWLCLDCCFPVVYLLNHITGFALLSLQTINWINAFVLPSAFFLLWSLESISNGSVSNEKRKRSLKQKLNNEWNVYYKKLRKEQKKKRKKWRNGSEKEPEEPAIKRTKDEGTQLPETAMNETKKGELAPWQKTATNETKKDELAQPPETATKEVKNHAIWNQVVLLPCQTWFINYEYIYKLSKTGFFFSFDAWTSIDFNKDLICWLFERAFLWCFQIWIILLKTKIIETQTAHHHRLQTVNGTMMLKKTLTRLTRIIFKTQENQSPAREGSRGINFHPRILNFLNNNYFYFNFKQKIDTCMKGTIKIN